MLPTPNIEQTGEKKTLRKVLEYIFPLVAVGVIFAIAMMANLDDFVEQLELKTYDLRAQFHEIVLHDRRPSKDVVIVKFDDPTMNLLNDEYGVWPWPRDIHAQMIDAMNAWGVRSILYDIMFVSYRKGSESADELFAKTFHKYDNVYLSMNLDNELDQSIKLGKGFRPQDIEQLKPLAIRYHSDVDPKNTSLRLKSDGFFDNEAMRFNHYRAIMPELLAKGSNIGFINHGSDIDGVSRSNPLFFRFEYKEFVKSPNLPVRQIAPGQWTDAKGLKTDKDGYLYERSLDYPLAIREGRLRDTNDRLVDKDGYLLNDYGAYQYKRGEMRYLYFPYLGLRAVLDLKFRNNIPDFTMTSDGHLKFADHNIPLTDKGNFLVNWYNVNVDREEQFAVLGKLQSYRNELLSKETQTPAMQMDLQKTNYLIGIYQTALNAAWYPQPYKEIPAWEVIRTMKKELSGLPLNAEDEKLKKELKNKIVFVGATAVAAYDIKNTSIHSTMPGVILQANLFDNLYQNNKYMVRADGNVNLAITVILVMLAAVSTFRMRSAWAGMMITAHLAFFYIIAAFVTFLCFQLWLNVAMPLVCLVITTTLTFMTKYVMRNKDYEKTYALATTDSMTGLYNHRFFQDHMRRSIEQATRFNHKFSLVLIDIDFFKKFNDTYGHQAGDEVLRQVAKKLKKNVRTVDIVARYGGEEMAVILDRATEEEALIVAHKLVKAIAEEAYPIAEGVAKHVTISVGVSTFPTHGKTPSEMIEFSDQGLYRAKENGRNQVGAQYDLPKEGGGHGPDAHGHGEHHVA